MPKEHLNPKNNSIILHITKNDKQRIQNTTMETDTVRY